jgi:hypothetical protein
MEKKIKLSTLKPNPSNPRVVKDDKFKKLVTSLEQFPQMLAKRPIICVTDTDGKLYPLGGNMRLKALQQLNYKEIPAAWVMLADEWTIEQRKEFTIKDNVGYGEWDWDILANEWDNELLTNWGLDVWKSPAPVDYSILDDEDTDGELNDMTNGVKRAIQIEFEAEHYEEAAELIKFWRDLNAYIGSMIIEHLKAEKNKL